MPFSPCVHTILCSLSAATLAALDTAVQAQILTLNTAIAAAQAQILKYDILLLPVQATNAAAQAALNQLRGVGNLIPSQLINGCTDFGNVTLQMQTSIDQISGPLNEITQDLSRLLSVRDELNALVEEYNQIIDDLNEFRLTIAECAAEVSA